MLYVYAFTEPAAATELTGKGLHDQPLQLQVCGSVAAVFSRLGVPDLEASSENLWGHERVVESLMTSWAVLPVRFGTMLTDEQRLGALLSHNELDVRRGLDRVRGCVELGLRVLGQVQDGDRAERPARAGSEAALATSGREYMQARLAEERRRRQELRSAEPSAQQIHASLAARALESTHRIAPAAGMLMTAAYLVQRESVDRFREHVSEISQTYRHLRVLCTGPWPPYHFVPRLRSPEACHV